MSNGNTLHPPVPRTKPQPTQHEQRIPGDQVTLRPLTIGDAEAIQATLSPDIADWLGISPVQNLGLYLTTQLSG